MSAAKAFPSGTNYLYRAKEAYGSMESMKKSLLETNPYLKNPTRRTEALARNIESSSAIEGIRVKRDTGKGLFVSQSEELTPPRKPAKNSR
jgi:hypothetical protein